MTTARPARIKGAFDDVHHPGARCRRRDPDVSDKPFFVRELPPLNKAELDGLLEVTRQRAEAVAVVDRADREDRAARSRPPASSTRP